MKTRIILTTIAVVLLAGTLLFIAVFMPEYYADGSATTPAQLMPFPEIDFVRPDGRTFTIKDVKEKTVLVHFWAAWCGPCQEELPTLLKYVTKAKGKIALIAISLDDDYADSRRMIARAGGSNTPHVYWAWDKDKTLSLDTFNTIKLPETIIVDQNRMMTDKIIGEGPWAEASGKP